MKKKQVSLKSSESKCNWLKCIKHQIRMQNFLVFTTAAVELHATSANSIIQFLISVQKVLV